MRIQFWFFLENSWKQDFWKHFKFWAFCFFSRAFLEFFKKYIIPKILKAFFRDELLQSFMKAYLKDFWKLIKELFWKLLQTFHNKASLNLQNLWAFNSKVSKRSFCFSFNQPWRHNLSYYVSKNQHTRQSCPTLLTLNPQIHFYSIQSLNFLIETTRTKQKQGNNCSRP